MKQQRKVEIYTDGACSGNPGPGGWGAILRFGDNEKELSGGEASTTNNRMELTAVIEAMRMLKRSCIVELYSDSKYIIDALEKGWAVDWQERGWIKRNRQPALNADLWETLLDLIQPHFVHYHWVQGHADNPYNTRCDELAVAARMRVEAEANGSQPERAYHADQRRISGLLSDEGDGSTALVHMSFRLPRNLCNRVDEYVSREAEDGDAPDDMIAALLSEALRNRGY